MCAIHCKILGNQKLLYAAYSQIVLLRILILLTEYRLGVFSETATRVDNNSKLDKLMQDFRGHTLLNVQHGVHQVLEHLVGTLWLALDE